MGLIRQSNAAINKNSKGSANEKPVLWTAGLNFQGFEVNFPSKFSAIRD